MHFTKIVSMIFAGALTMAGPAGAAPTSVLEVKIELRVLDFIASPNGRTVVAVLYDRDMRGSAEEAAAILQALEEWQGTGRSKILPRLVELHALSSAKALKAIILPASLSDLSAMQYGLANQTLVLSSGSACLRDHHCMVGVSTQPEVEIGVDSPSIEDARIQFADGFQLMVKEY
jgi:hypothetical protein